MKQHSDIPSTYQPSFNSNGGNQSTTWTQKAHPFQRQKKNNKGRIASNCRDLLTFNICIPSTKNVIHWSVLRSAANDNNRPNLHALNPNYSSDETQDSNKDSLFSIEVEDAADKAREGEIKRGIAHKRAAISVHSGVSMEVTPALVSREDMDKDDPRLMEATTNIDVPDLMSIIGATFPIDIQVGLQRAVVKEEIKDSTGYLGELNDGSTKVVEYNLIMCTLNASAEDEDSNFCTFSDILDHRKKHGKWEVNFK